jgi:hypothetical protein
MSIELISTDSVEVKSMRIASLTFILIPLLAAGCNSPSETAGAGGHGRGRYSGIGIYTPSGLWTQQSDAALPADKATAKLSDDDEIIVSIDGQTGEVRQCGNHSGHCISLSAWGPGSLKTPLTLSKHAEELAEDLRVELEATPVEESKR